MSTNHRGNIKSLHKDTVSIVNLTYQHENHYGHIHVIIPKYQAYYQWDIQEWIINHWKQFIANKAPYLPKCIIIVHVWNQDGNIQFWDSWEILHWITTFDKTIIIISTTLPVKKYIYIAGYFIQIGITKVEYSVYPYIITEAHPLEAFKVITKFLIFPNALWKMNAIFRKWCENWRPSKYGSFLPV